MAILKGNQKKEEELKNLVKKQIFLIKFFFLNGFSILSIFKAVNLLINWLNNDNFNNYTKKT